MLAAACGGSDVSRSEVIDVLTEGGTLSQTQAECAVDGIEAHSDVSLNDFSDSSDPSEEQVEILFTIMGDCLGGSSDDTSDASDAMSDSSEAPSDAGDAAGGFSHLAPTDPPPGTDEALDALWVACGEGSASACDELFLEAPVDSDYELFGLSCGAREITFCATILEG